MRFRLNLLAVLAAALTGTAAMAGGETHTIFFDNGGEEEGVTFLGATDFSIFGSNWSGGFVGFSGNTELYASGLSSYHVADGFAQVTFDIPIVSANFFFVHGAGTVAGTANAFDGDGGLLGSIDSNNATFFGDPANFVTFDFEDPISSITFDSEDAGDGPVIDNFMFTTIPAPAGVALFAMAGLRRTRRRSA